MSAGKHTPGRWTTDGGNTVMSAESDQLNGGYAVCVTHGPDQNANASMIAANPDPLEALESIMASARAGNAAILDRLTRQAEAAIAKATGEAK